jgi:hypothetical protein
LERIEPAGEFAKKREDLRRRFPVKLTRVNFGFSALPEMQANCPKNRAGLTAGYLFVQAGIETRGNGRIKWQS